MSRSRSLASAIRRHAVIMTSRGGSSHVGSVLSCADILAVLYDGVLSVDPDRPDWAERDRFVLSKGHAGAGLYAVLAESGFISRDELLGHCADGSRLSGHVSHAVPGVEVSTGSLGHGLPVAVGLALGLRDRLPYVRIVCLVSDGECDEGTTWESALLANHHRLSNLLVVIDANGMQSLRSTEETLALEPLVAKWHAFGWTALEVDGHDHVALREAMTTTSDGPVIVVARTTKGKGVSFMENSVLWHYRSPQGEELERALEELAVEDDGRHEG